MCILNPPLKAKAKTKAAILKANARIFEAKAMHTVRAEIKIHIMCNSLTG